MYYIKYSKRHYISRLQIGAIVTWKQTRIILKMSQPIRQVIGPTKKRILDLLKDWKETQSITVDQSLPLEEKLNRIKQQIFVLEGLKLRLTKATNLLQTKNDEWTVLIQSLKRDSRQQEADLYEQFNQPSDGSQGFIADMLYAQDQILVIENHLRELQYAKSTMEMPTPVSSPATFSEGHSFVSTAPTTQTPPVQGGLPIVSLTAKLPKLPLPEFHGDETNFAPFWDVFESTIHNRTDLTAGDKFRYLVGLLKGDAFKIIAGIKVTGDNYQHAIAGLRERYGSSRVIKQNLYSQMEKLPICGSTKVQELQETLDNIEKILRQLETQQEYLNHTLLINQVKNKFPAEIIFELERLRGLDSDWTMNELRHFLKEVISVYKRAFCCHSYKHTVCSAIAENFEVELSQNNARKSNLHPCIFCGNAHYNSDCQMLRTEQERADFLKQNRMCLYCFKPGHFKPKCLKFGQIPCFYCKQTNHNSALCRFVFGSFSNANQMQNINQQSSNNNSNNSQHTAQSPTQTFGLDCSSDTLPTPEEYQLENEESEDRSNNFLCSNLSTNKCTTTNRKKTKLLLTAFLTLKNPEMPHVFQRVRAIFDSGCDETFLLASIQQKLQLKTGPTEENCVMRFGNEINGPMRLLCKSAQTMLMLQDGSYKTLEIQIVDSISKSYKRPAISPEDLETLKMYDNHLADKIPTKPECFEIEMLVGLKDFLSLVQTDNLVQLPSGLHLVPSSIGLLLGGSTAVHEIKCNKTVVSSRKDSSPQESKNFQWKQGANETKISANERVNHKPDDSHAIVSVPEKPVEKEVNRLDESMNPQMNQSQTAECPVIVTTSATVENRIYSQSTMTANTNSIQKSRSLAIANISELETKTCQFWKFLSVLRNLVLNQTRTWRGSLTAANGSKQFIPFDRGKQF